jgi:hypothetical protein
MTINPKSLENLNPKARYMGKQRFNTTLQPKTIAWLQSGGNASQRIEDLVNAAKAGELKHTPIAAAEDNQSNYQETINELTATIKQLTEKITKLEEMQLGMIDNGIIDHIEDEIQDILTKNANKTQGYKTNGFGEGIKKLRSLLVDLG